MYGDEDQNDLMQMIKNYKGEEEMKDTKVAEIMNDINNYTEQIENLHGALEAAEQELEEELARRSDEM